MSFAALVRIIARRWLVVVACMVLGGVLGGVLSQLQPPSYEAQAQALFGLQTTAESTGSSQDLLAQMPTYAALANTSAVLGPAAQQLGVAGDPQSLSSQVAAVAPDGTLILRITATDPDPERAAAIANAVATAYSRLVDSVQVGALPVGADTAGRVTVAVVQSAVVPTDSATISPLVLVVGGVLVGLLVVVIVLMVRETLAGSAGEPAAAPDETTGPDDEAPGADDVPDAPEPVPGPAANGEDPVKPRPYPRTPTRS